MCLLKYNILYAFTDSHSKHDQPLTIFTVYNLTVTLYKYDISIMQYLLYLCTCVYTWYGAQSETDNLS